MSIDPNEEDEEDDIPKPQEKKSEKDKADTKEDDQNKTDQSKDEGLPQDPTEVIDLDDSGDKEELQVILLTGCTVQT